VRAICFDEFGGPLRVADVADPAPAADGAVIAMRATGLCRSDWHGWRGHDPDIATLPHVPGHEFVGEIAEVGRDVRAWHVGDRVTIPFVAGCGTCAECSGGAPQVCPQQHQPGFSGWGSFADFVAVRHADFNLVRVPPEIDDVTAAAFGCRLATAYRAVALQGRAAAGEWVAVHGCGGVGLSAVMVAAALGARVVAIDVSDEALALATNFGAECVINARAIGSANVAEAIREATGRGAHLSLDALGSAETAANSLRCLRPRGRHVQVGLLAGAEAQPRLPMELVISRELEIRGSHGMAAADYGPLLALAVSGKIRPAAMVRAVLPLDAAVELLPRMAEFPGAGITVLRV
jgi:D-arabinose 1-dehydrogenase-like Zn-dependent alcohol dehydrogenase